MKYINLPILRVNIYLVEELDSDNPLKVEVYLVEELNGKNLPILRVNTHLVEESDGNIEDILWIN